jgi:hypothetical protein
MIKYGGTPNLWSQTPNIRVGDRLLVYAALLGDLAYYPNSNFMQRLACIASISTADTSENLKNIIDLLTHCDTSPSWLTLSRPH